MNNLTTYEKRIRRLEEMILALLGRLKGMDHKLGQVAEDNARDTRPLPQSGSGAKRYFAQVAGSAAVTAAVSNTLGSGTANILQLVGTVRYQESPERTVPVVNSTAGSIPLNTYLELILDAGVYSIVVGSCSGSPTKAPAPPGG